MESEFPSYEVSPAPVVSGVASVGVSPVGSGCTSSVKSPASGLSLPVVKESPPPPRGLGGLAGSLSGFAAVPSMFNVSA